jgi:ATP synthase protein I
MAVDILARPMTPQPGNTWSGMGEGWGTAWSISSTMIAGPLAWGGLGALVDWWLGFRWLFLPIGMVVGMAGSIYLVIKRYGTDESSD